MADIFISYSKQNREIAEALADQLELKGYSVWWDTNLLSGDRFRKTIMSELAESKAVIVLWTKNSVESDWVISEASRGLALNKLVALKDEFLDYNQIPPPFDNLHTDNINSWKSTQKALIQVFERPDLPNPAETLSTHARHAVSEVRSKIDNLLTTLKAAAALFMFMMSAFISVMLIFQEGKYLLGGGVAILAWFFNLLYLYIDYKDEYRGDASISDFFHLSFARLIRGTIYFGIFIAVVLIMKFLS